MMILRTAALVLAVLVARAAWAEPADQQNIPRLKASVTVTRDVVRIGDLVENAGEISDVAIFRSPESSSDPAWPTRRGSFSRSGGEAESHSSPATMASA